MKKSLALTFGGCDMRTRQDASGVKSAAIKLYQKRKTEILEGKKLPEQLRGRVVRFAEIADDALAYVKANNQGQQFDAYRIGRLKDEFGLRRRNTR
jgi:hypothetical protein